MPLFYGAQPLSRVVLPALIKSFKNCDNKNGMDPDAGPVPQPMPPRPLTESNDNVFSPLAIFAKIAYTDLTIQSKLSKCRSAQERVIGNRVQIPNDPVTVNGTMRYLPQRAAHLKQRRDRCANRAAASACRRTQGPAFQEAWKAGPFVAERRSFCGDMILNRKETPL